MRLLVAMLCLAGGPAYGAGYDLIITHAKVIDGTGNPWFFADIGVKDGRIARVGNLGEAQATRRIDVQGMFVTPGFIDIHSHSDRGLSVPELRHSPNMVAQGITLSVLNQDGRHPMWPLTKQKALYETEGVGNNVILMAGHGSLRTAVMGRRASQPATDADIRAMQQLVEQGMKDGGYGLSTGLEYVPGRFSEPREVIELTRVVKPYGGIYISHERSEGKDPMWKTLSDPTPGVDLLEAVAETINLGRQTGVPVVCSHLKAKGANYWGSSYAAIRLIAEAREQGLEVYADQYPYETSGTDGRTVLIPLWAMAAPGQEVGGQLGQNADGGVFRNAKENLQTRLADPKSAERVRADIEHEIARRGGPDRVVLYDFPDKRYVEKSLSFVAADRKMSPVDAAIWIERTGIDGMLGGARMRGYSLSEIDIDHIMRQDFTATCTDGDTEALGHGTPHARYYGTMPRKIRRYSLDRGVISLPFAIRSMTSLPAQILRLKDRGQIREGNWADLVVFDPATIADKATFTNPHQYPDGIPYVFVNGVAVVDGGKLTKALPGKVLTPQNSQR